MDWAQKRRIVYGVAFAGIVILLAAYPVYRLAYRTPTCFDAKQNGAETGVDCGGGCALVCVADVKPLRVVWAKAFPLNGNYYDIGAYIENSNTRAGVKIAQYTIRVIGASGDVLIEKKGETVIAPGARTVIFEPNIEIAKTPARVEISFNIEDLTRWTNARVASSVLSIKNKILKNTDTKPRLDAVLVNTDSVNDVSNLTLSAIIYDAQGRPVAVSKTYVDFIPKAGEQEIFFTWPSKFEASSGSFITEIVVSPQVIFAE
ncbi:MAG: hypothetical protein HZB10_00340 [Candidatus Yonathbacteria bacterium]|nr:hypothetical protein [Candidatus Yonathbacteria bacterium]